MSIIDSPLRPYNDAFVDIGMHGGSAFREDYQAGWQVWCGQYFSYKSIMDVGAGLGFSRSRLAVNENRVVTQDVAPDLPVDLHTPLAQIPSGCVDVVTAFDVIEHVVEDDAFLANLLRIARKYVVFSTPNYEISRCANPAHCREYTPAALVQLVSTARVETFLAANSPFSAVSMLDLGAFLAHTCDAHGAVLHARNPS